jgi:monofunctional biosynthetic peptidoglycan transglycosylase
MRRVGQGLAALAGVGFGCAAYVYLTLPDVRLLRSSTPSTTAFIELRAREARARGKEPRRIQRWVSYARISPHLKRAVLVAEDSAFWQHDGIDYEQLKESRKESVSVAVKKSGSKTSRALDRQTSRGGVVQAAHPRAVSEPD